MSTAATIQPKTTTAAAGETTAPAATKTPLTNETFRHHMTAMALHYKTTNTGTGGATHLYPLPVSILHPVDHEGNLAPQAKPSDAGKADMKKVLSDGETKVKSFTQAQHDFVQGQSNQLQSNHDTAQFAASMNAQRNQAKQQSDQNIDNMYKKLIDVGTKHPALQPEILTATQKLGALLTSLLSSVMSFFTDIYNKIVQWISSAANWIKDAAATAAKWLSGALGTVAHGFSSLFSWL